MLSVYIHIPFCKKRCNYCDFITYAGIESLIPAYVGALCKEMDLILEREPAKASIHTVYFGGGTPSLLSPTDFERIINHLHKHGNISSDAEITVEANPGAVSDEFYANLYSLGVNRISLGAQSLRDADLIKLGRIHKASDIHKSLDSARQAGFTNISLDLIFGLPWQKIDEWKAILSEVIELDCTHLSLYDLSLEPGTPLFHWVEEGKYAMLDNDICADMYELAIEKLADAGYIQYEISNWSRGGAFESRHNKQYWRNLPYRGFGAGAHSYMNGQRLENTPSVQNYIDVINTNFGKDNSRTIDPACIANTEILEFEQMQDSMMLGLRMVKEGVDGKVFKERFGENFVDVFESEILLLTQKKMCELIEIDGIDHFRLTRQGIPLANQAFKLFVGD